MNTKSEEVAERLKKAWSGPMSEKEIAFVRDIEGFIDFAVRNGLHFPMVMSLLAQDVNEILRYGLSLDKALAGGFQPGVTRYAKLTEDSFGGEDDPLD